MWDCSCSTTPVALFHWPVASTTVRPAGKRGVTTWFRKVCQSASATVPPPGRLRPKYKVSRTRAVSPGAHDGLGSGPATPGRAAQPKAVSSAVVIRPRVHQRQESALTTTLEELHRALVPLGGRAR